MQFVAYTTEACVYRVCECVCVQDCAYSCVCICACVYIILLCVYDSMFHFFLQFEPSLYDTASVTYLQDACIE